MSLDKRTLEWLKGRKVFPNRDFNRHYFCAYCDHFKSDRLCVSALCPITAAHVVPRDVAEFEARVNVILANGVESCEHCPALGWCDFPACEESRLKFARLVVESEMEMEKNNEKHSA